MVVTVCSASGQKPTVFCPTKRTMVCLALPQNETEVTDDSFYGIPGDCTIHTSISTIIDPIEGETDPSSEGPSSEQTAPVEPGLGPSYIPRAPLDNAPLIGTRPGQTSEESTSHPWSSTLPETETIDAWEDEEDWDNWWD